MTSDTPPGFTATQRRDVLVLAVFRGLSFLGDGLALVALYLRVAPRGHAWAVAGLGLAAMIPFVIFAPLSGLVADRVRAKPYLVALGVGETVVGTALGVWHSVGATLALVVLLNCVVAFSMPGYAALLPSVAGESNVAAAQGIFQSTQGISTVLGPILGGLLVGAFGQSIPLYVDGASFAVGALGTALLRADRRPERRAPGEKDSAWDGVRLLVGDSLLRDLTVLIFVFMLAVGVSNVAEVFYVTQTFHGSAFAYGALGASFGVGMILGSVMSSRWGSETVTLTRRTILGVMVIGMAVALVGAVNAVYQIYPLMVVAGAAVGVANVCGTTVFFARTPDAVRGRMMSAFMATSQVAQVGATVAGGAVLSLIAPRTVYWWSGGVATGVSLVVGLPVLARLSRGVHEVSGPGEGSPSEREDGHAAERE